MRIGSSGVAEGVRQCPSPNCDDRPHGLPVSLLVVHAISLPPGTYGGDSIERLFTNCLDPQEHPYFREIAALKVSAHFLLRRGGELVQFVPVSRRAWHAGISAWRGRTGCNDMSVGVELEGAEDDAFTHAQYTRFAELGAALRGALPIRNIAAHSDLAPGRKADPGRSFDWERVLRTLAGYPSAG
ncbi:MAG: 1,6-anhydro-N-acetylmuramyl-L-alanine amidase AmpD [Proteobacteria bacterium]|nr:1,6-anhydro-N-acetylmuramyl-L-alanine amidase AmpD [Pseudomonadota bacterium]